MVPAVVVVAMEVVGDMVVVLGCNNCYNLVELEDCSHNCNHFVEDTHKVDPVVEGTHTP